MDKRWLIAGGAVVVIGAACWLLRSDDSVEAKTAPTRNARVAVNQPRSGETPAAAPAPKKKWHKPVEVWDPSNKSFRREIVDADPEDEAERARKDDLLYKTRRLRLSASDAAAQCWKGGDIPEEIHISYSVVVDKEAVHSENVRVLENNISDPAVTACIVQSVRDMTSFSDGLPNMKQDFELTMSLHDLFVRNRQFAGDENARHTTVDPQPTPIDLPPATVAPAKP